METAKALEQRLSIAKEQEQAIVSVSQQLEAQIAELQREVLFSPERVRAGVKVLADTVIGMKTTQTASANTLGHSSMEEDKDPNATDTGTSVAGTPT